MKYTLLFTLVANLSFGQPFQITPNALQDKIKGGWAGQTIGVTYGAPVEFHFQGSMINDYQPIIWYDGYIKKSMLEAPGIYDDLYMDLTFVDIFETQGLDAPIAEHARAYAQAGYMLWHANQAGRYNILQGKPAPQSGHWLNNPHADDIDFQIEADFSGLMSPGMPNTAAQIGDGIGHIMNYGDGWYGGVFIGAMYALAFTSTNIQTVVRQGLNTIPTQSTFYQCISDVIRWHDQYPNDWKQTWFEVQKKWSDDLGCPDGVFSAFNIDARINAAYVVMGLLYGNGDFGKTLEIAARTGQDADCNPSSAGGILGTLLGYDKIPAYWKMGLREAEDINFKFTNVSLNKVYALSYKHALQVIRKNGGSVGPEIITINTEVPKAVRLEQSFEGHYPVGKQMIHKNLTTSEAFRFTGKGFVVKGYAKPRNQSAESYTGNFVFVADLFVDGVLVETANLPADFIHRRHELFWKYQLSNQEHTVEIKLHNPSPDFEVRITEVLIYSDKK
ncbi:MAG: ADP-ribosylglycohydrolase family protein [Cyclobacteriaceae bacterium]|nr:hypothetical protein [Cytophagales bacterium]HNP76079.1 ADP-ribosylglycohydrolase family protein [Cyclobacteriaceae bacterium]